MQYPKHSDPRAYHLFSQGYVGNRMGDVLDHECAKDRKNGTACQHCATGGEARSNYSTYFLNKTKDVEPSTTIAVDYQTHYCAYCGNRAHVLQYDDCGVRGYVCSCAAACDEREYVAKREEMRERHYAEVKELEKLAPQQPKEVLAAIWERESDRIKQSILRGCQPSALERLGIIVGDVEDH